MTTNQRSQPSEPAQSDTSARKPNPTGWPARCSKSPTATRSSRNTSSNHYSKSSKTPPTGDGAQVRSRLTCREWEMIDLLAADTTTQQIAEQLVLTADTVYSHIKSVLRKLGRPLTRGRDHRRPRPAT